jgi:hypothetical protein
VKLYTKVISLKGYKKKKVTGLREYRRKKVRKAVLEEQMEHSYIGSEAHLTEMTFKEKREVLKGLFSGKNYARSFRQIFGRVKYDKPEKGKGRNRGKYDDGVPYGVYVYKNNGQWRFAIEGNFQPITCMMEERKKLNVQMLGVDHIHI